MVIFLLVLPTILSIGHDPYEIDFSKSSKMPSLDAIYGTDELGRDIAARIATTLKNQVLITWFVVILGFFVGCAGGVIISANYTSFGVVWIYKLINLASSLPIMCLCFGLAIYQGYFSSRNLYWVILVFTSFSSFNTISNFYTRDRLLEYWHAHELIGGSLMGRIWRYGALGCWQEQLKNSLVIHMQLAIAIETSMSYLRMGIQDPDPSFGNMITHSYSAYFHGHFENLIIILMTFFSVWFTPPLLRSLSEILWKRVRTDLSRNCHLR